MRGSRPKQNESLTTFISGELEHKKINDLSTDGINLLNLLTLIVDIEYRYRYGDLPSWQERQMKNSIVLADQLTSVDKIGSARLASTEANWR